MKDSGAREFYGSGMTREPEVGRPRFDLLVPENVPFDEQFLTKAAVHMAKGAEKYAARQWEVANSKEELDRYKSSAIRHLMQWLSDEDDEDHASAILFNLLAGETVKYRMRVLAE